MIAMESNKVKLLDNYQLYQLGQNKYLDEETQMKVHKELVLRNIPTIELKEFERRHIATFDKPNEALAANTWDPLYTAFAWRKHFKHIALLKAFQRKKEAQVYQLRFYVGMAIYMLLFIFLLLLFRR